MALATLTVGHIRRLLDGLPDDQDVLLIDRDGVAVEITDIDPLTVTDLATNKQVLTLEFSTNEDSCFGFDEGMTTIDSESDD